MKKIVILGSTGSIGKQTLQVIDEFPDKFKVIGLAAGSNVELMASQIKKYKPKYVSLSLEKNVGILKDMLDNNIEVLSGANGLLELAQIDEADIIVVAVNGIHGLRPTLAALDKGKTVALANKETIVTAGSMVMEKSRQNGAKILPVDSEHSAIFQCLEEKNQRSVDKLILTASGGPFLNYSFEELKRVTPKMALSHPNWSMGAKITVDCAGLINKGLEVIEAHWLFKMPYESIEVVVHPQSVIHSMVQYDDGSVLAQLGCADMRIPIQYALTYPMRIKNTFPKLDFYKINALTFEKPNLEKFPGLALAIEAGKVGGTMTIVYNGANEEAVHLFLEGKIGFTEIPQIIGRVMFMHKSLEKYNLDDILEIDKWSRIKAREISISIKGGI
ncbi:MAG: 1-deoxy-D-xylulose-5-phosphate reductoisomerase [Clostridia bacterium]|nr:1-deoxy-D-xylulose-5-phosphate reductoisomerase [Clostridia bacterium]